MALPRIAYYAATSSVAVLTTAVTTYVAVVYSRTSPIAQSQVSVSRSVPDTFRDSDTVRKLINPKGHIERPDTHSMTIHLPARHFHLSDEALLARVVKEFYSGWVFTPERWLLRLFRKNLVGFADVSSRPIPGRIWKLSELSASKLPPLYSVIFGAWQVVDLKLSTHDESKDNEESYVDLAYGSDSFPFAGCNRFSIQRLDAAEDAVGGSTQVRITYAQTNCNPLVNQRPFPDFMFTFHKIYAMLLYREVMSGLQRWLHEPQQQPGSPVR